VIKDLDIVFVGRLVSDKGVSDLIEAMGELAEQTSDRDCQSLVAQNDRSF